MMLGIVGSREYPDLERVTDWLERYIEKHPLEGVVSGGARGVDRTGELWAKDTGVRVVSFRPVNLGESVDTYDPKQMSYCPWAIDRRVWNPSNISTSTVLAERYRGFAAAAFVRNGYIVEWADQVVAFWNGKSTGTQHSINRARQDGKLLEVVR